MSIPESLLGVHTHADAGYLPLVDFGAWRVAILNFSDDLRPKNIKAMQRHDATDEAFVLLRGRCILFVGEGDRPFDLQRSMLNPCGLTQSTTSDNRSGTRTFAQPGRHGPGGGKPGYDLRQLALLSAHGHATKTDLRNGSRPRIIVKRSTWDCCDGGGCLGRFSFAGFLK